MSSTSAAGGKIKEMKKGGRAALQKRWKCRVGSPRELVWELHQFLTDKGYKLRPYEALDLHPAPIEGVATFETSLQGHYDVRWNSWWRLILGVVLFFTILLIPIGIWLIKTSSCMLSHVFKLHVEGETFRASARTQDPYRAQSEVLDIATNGRITLEAELLVTQARETKRAGSKSGRDRLEWDRVEGEFDQLAHELDKLIPKIVLPEAIEDS